VGKKRNTYWVLVGKHERKRPLARQRHKWEDNIKKVINEVGWEGMDWIGLA
jgi:CRISPR/Cas system-associated endonuclease/helicase Cas3